MSTRVDRGPSRAAPLRPVDVRVLITGAGGLVGGALCSDPPPDAEVVGVIRRRPAPAGVASVVCDLTDDAAVSEVVSRTAPDVVIHCAYSRERADIVDATRSVASACAETGSRLVHMSTDVVFDGDSPPYAESDEPRPITEYGSLKLEAERIVADLVPDAAIVRTSLIVSADPLDDVSRSLVTALLARRRVPLFIDEFRAPIRLDDIVSALWEIAGLEDGSGVWHVTGPDRLSRVELGRAVARAHGCDPSLILESSVDAFGGPRARDVTLSCERSAARLSARPRGLGSIA
jgi:dTDP-4-dehydrorhamnose reductase